MEKSNLPTTQQTAVQQTVALKSLLSAESTKKRFGEILGKKAPGFISSIISAVNGSLELQKCAPETIIGAAAIAASLDLPIVPGLGFAGLIPFWNTKKNCYECQFQVMKKGYIQLAQRSGQVSLINAGPVYEGQLKSHNSFTGEYEFQEAKTSEKIIGYVGYVKFINGFEKYKYMTITDLLNHAKKYSKSFLKGNGKWADNTDGGFEQMCEKTVLKLLLSTYAPLSIEMQNAIVFDQAAITEPAGPEEPITPAYIDNDKEPGKVDEAKYKVARQKILGQIAKCKTLEKIEEIELLPDIENMNVYDEIQARKAEIKTGAPSENKKPDLP
jgi:recombination protein RecT